MAKKAKLGLAWKIGIGVVGLATVVVFTKSLITLFEDWFTANALIIAVVSGVLLALFLVTGVITVRQVKKKLKW